MTRAVQHHYDERSFDCMGDVVLEQVRRRTLLGAVGEHFDLERIEKVLDVGCGASARNPFFVRRYWGKEAVAVDLSRRTLGRAKARIHVPYVNASVLHLPFRAESFDFAMSTGVIHHTSAPRAALRELKRVVRPGGGLFVSVYNRRSVYHPVYRYLGGLFRAMLRWGWEPLLRGLFVPLYALAYRPMVWAAVGEVVPVPYRQAAADFDDKFLTPHALFHTLEQVQAWIEDEGLTCLAAGSHMATMMLGFLIRK